MEKIIHDLDLTEEQQESLKSYRQENQERMRTLHEKLKEARETLKTELEKTKSNNRTIQRLASVIKSAQAEMVDNRIETVLHMKEVLTEEQFQEFRAKAAEAKEKVKGFIQKKREQFYNKNQGDNPWHE